MVNSPCVVCEHIKVQKHKQEYAEVSIPLKEDGGEMRIEDVSNIVLKFCFKNK